MQGSPYSKIGIIVFSCNIRYNRRIVNRKHLKNACQPPDVSPLQGTLPDIHPTVGKRETRFTFPERLYRAREAIAPIFPQLVCSVINRIPCHLSEMTVLDLGGGDGTWIEAFFAAGVPVGILLDREAVAVECGTVRLSGLPGSTFLGIRGVAESIPLKSGCVDLIVSRNALHFWNPLEISIQEAFRVLKPGGNFFCGRGFGPDLSQTTREIVKERRKEYYRSFVLDRVEADEPPSPTPEVLENLLRETGFSTIQVIPDHKSYWVSAKKPASYQVPGVK
ncbi:MAG: class I SAM-dependent methyltransferase [Candidatus Ozemobacteraceae bacterium]